MKKILIYIILLMGVTMAGIVAYVSVNGLLKVFTGAGTMGLMFFTSIEIAKIVATSAIHTHGKKIGWFYNILLSFMVIISMAITSMGIYGFLSSSYKESFAKMENVDSQVVLLENKKNSYLNQLTTITNEKEALNTTISELTKGLSNNVIQYKDKETGEIITTTSSSTRRVLEKQLDKAIGRQEILNTNSEGINTIVFDLDSEILEVKLGNDSANELSTLKYLADITGTSMDEVMKWFILLLIIIGDPMAVLMVIVFNKVIKDDNVVTNLIPEEPIIEEPVVEPIAEAVIVQPIIEEPVVEEPVVEPIIEEPVVEPVVEEPVVEPVVEPIADAIIVEPVVEEPIVEPIVEAVPEEPVASNKREPIIPRGRIIAEDVVKKASYRLKDKRGFSVEIPPAKKK